MGEAWLLSDHALHASRVTNGPLAGSSIRALMEQRCIDLLGREAKRFPLLIKLLDARENLSVQVHPDDDTAKHLAPEEGGKTEAWHVLEADPEATIFLGMKPECDRAALIRAIDDGTAPACLHRYHPHPGDSYFVPAGSIHALGGGVVVLEVQQTSDATFRLYDWGRVDAAGRPRQLHLDKGLTALRELSPSAGRIEARPIAHRADGEHLVSCPHFHIDRFQLRDRLPLVAPCLWFGLSGVATVTCSQCTVEVRLGELALIPACVKDAEVLPQEASEGILIRLG